VNRRIALLLTAAGFASVSCAPRLVSLPSGAGSPFPEFAAAWEQATDACRNTRTIAAVLAISGRAAGQRFRAKLDGGFAAPARVRLELPAPGRPIFVYVVNGDRATLVFPRDGRVLRDAPPAETFEALAGVSLGPDDLRAIVTGCGFSSGAPSGGRSFDAGWAAVNAGSATSWLEQVAGAWRLVAGASRGVDVRYSDFTGGRPGTIRLRTTQGAPTDLTIRLSQVDVNQPLEPAVFEADVPAGATPMTLQELREAGPLGR
jgi:hypothetical protein